MLKRLLLGLIAPGQAKYMTLIERVEIRSWITPWVVPFLVVGIVALVAWGYGGAERLTSRQKITLACLRALAYVLLLFTLAMPTLEISGQGSPPGPVPVVVDATESMQINDADGQPRTSQALSVLAGILDSAGQYKDLRFAPYWAGRHLVPYDPKSGQVADGDRTSLNQMLEGGLRDHLGVYCPGFILLGDGAHNAPEIVDDTIRLFKERHVPVYACGIGREKSKDVAVAYVLSDDVMFKGEKTKLYVNVRQQGYPGASAELAISLDDRRLLSKSVVFTDDVETSIPVEFVPEGKGFAQLKTEILSLDGEITAENNAFVKNVRVIDEKVRILMVFGAPSWEYRYLVGAFERDQRVRFQVYLGSLDQRVLINTKSDRFISTLPATRRELHENCDIVFLSRIDARNLPPAFRAALRDFVKEEAGGVAVLADPVYVPYTLKGTELEELLPLALGAGIGQNYGDELFRGVKQPLVFELTADGLSSPLLAFSGSREDNLKLWSELPPSYFCYADGKLKPAAISLLTASRGRDAQRIPAIVQQTYGKGPVLFMGFDSTWRWRKEYGDRYFREYWGKVIQFLGLPHLLNEAARATLYVNQENCAVGEKIAIRAQLSNADFSPYMAAEVRLVVDENGKAGELALQPAGERMGLYRGTYAAREAGTVKLQLPEAFPSKPVLLRVVKRRQEFLDSAMNRTLLEKIAKETGGRFYTGGQAATLVKDLFEHRPLTSMQVKVSLWDSAFFMAAALVLLCVEWLLRKILYLD